ncbi:MAG: hypothetical protein CFE26_04450 [Verrucomicrobiales bacterium VVV1]|nr:MAG: hypothetical protein CFE26_04450 [Verrucomicrobiales bacterium VVV1]
MTTKVGKSKIETGPGVHKDTIYIITVQVEGVSKGEAATFYLTGGGKEPVDPITPNGVVVDKAR